MSQNDNTSIWSIPDPAKAQGTEEDIRKAFELAFSMLKRHIEDLLNE